MTNEHITGADLRARRIAADMTQQTAATRAGLSCNTVSAWERGIRTPHHATLAAYLAVVDTTFDDTTKEQ